MRYLIRYVDATSSQVREAVVAALSAGQAQAQLLGQGQAKVVLSVVEQRGSTHKNQRFDVAWWCRELRTLLLSGMTVVEAIETLAASRNQGPQQSGVHEKLLRALHEGRSLSNAMQDVDAFPEVLVASVTASERTSTLSAALEDYLRYDEMLSGLRRKIVSAAIYPAVVVSLGVLITLFLLVFVIPRFSTMYLSSPKTLSTATQSVLWVSQLMRAHLPLVLAGLAGFVLLLVWSFRQGHALRVGVWLVDSVSPLSAQWNHFRLAKLYQSMALMYKGGYTLDEALQVGQGMDLGSVIGRGIRTARQEISRGKAAGAAFEAAGLTEPVTLRLIGVGERTGSFDTVMQTIADRHAQAFATFVERSTRIVEPTLMLLVALIVGGVVVMMYMPIFDMANGIGAGA